MEHYDFQKKFRAVYDRALKSFQDGASNADALLDGDEAVFLKSFGGRAQDVFDYAEDVTNYGEPDFETALMIEAVRRDYFFAVQKSEASDKVLDESTMPAKKDEVHGIAWLPRLMPKARAKLRGELPQNLMYCCGGDREFFKTHDIHPAEFLRAAWAYEDNDEKMIAWVENRSKAAASAG